MIRCRLIAALCLFSLAASASCQDSQGQQNEKEARAAVPQAEQPTQPPSGSSAAPPSDPREEMTRVAGGTFQYGATETQFRAYLSLSVMNFPGMQQQMRRRFVIPPRPVTLKDFWMDPFEVTNRLFLEFLQSSGYQPADSTDFLHHWETPRRYPEWAAEFPVVWVSAHDAQAYCEWRGGRLPTDEEWERAARGDDSRYFPWGNKAPSRHETAVFSGEQSEPVGSRAGDISPYEIYDMGGNVSEWTSSTESLEGKTYQLARGGNFRETARETLAYNRRFEPLATPRNDHTGFRCVAQGGRNQEE